MDLPQEQRSGDWAKEIEPVQINVCLSNTYTKCLSWLHVDDKSLMLFILSVHPERQQVKDQ